jgi:hypothetical protein
VGLHVSSLRKQPSCSAIDLNSEWFRANRFPYLNIGVLVTSLQDRREVKIAIDALAVGNDYALPSIEATAEAEYGSERASSAQRTAWKNAGQSRAERGLSGATLAPRMQCYPKSRRDPTLKDYGVEMGYCLSDNRSATMQRLGRIIFVTVFISIFPAMGGAGASEAQRFAVLTTAMEAALATTSLIRDRTASSLESVSWHLQFSDRHWVLELKGSSFGCQLSGYLWGEDNADWLVSFAGSGGMFGKEPIYVNGKAEWLYDRISADHPAMNFYNAVKFGENSLWGWVVGSELIVGGAVGGLIGFASTAATGPLAVLVGIQTAISGAAGMWAISNGVSSLLQSDTPVSAPAPPSRPPVPQKDEKLEPQKGKILIALTSEKVAGSGPADHIDLSGTFSGNNTGTGTISAH